MCVVCVVMEQKANRAARKGISRWSRLQRPHLVTVLPELPHEDLAVIIPRLVRQLGGVPHLERPSLGDLGGDGKRVDLLDAGDEVGAGKRLAHLRRDLCQHGADTARIGQREAPAVAGRV